MQLCRRRLIHLQKIVHKIYMFFFIYHVDLTVISLFPASLPALDNFFPAMHMQCHCPDKNAYLLHVLSSGPKHPYFPDDPDPDAKSSQILFSLRQCLFVGIHKQFAACMLPRHFEWNLCVCVHLVHLVHKFHIAVDLSCHL